MNWIYPLYICEFLLFFIAFFLSQNDIMAPSVIMCTMFILSTTVAILAGSQVKIKYGAESFGILVAGIFTFILTEALSRKWFQRKVTRATKMRRLQELQTQGFHVIHIQGWLIVTAIAMDMVILPWYIHDMLRFAGGLGGAVRAATTQIVVTSWDDAYLNPVLTQLMKVVKALGYISGFVLIQRIVVREKGIFQAVGLLMLVILAQVQAVVAASRGEILQFLTALMVYYNILWHQKNGWHRNMSWKFIRIGIICIVVGIPIFSYAIVWMGRTSLKDMRAITETVNLYLGYPIYLFDMFVKKPFSPVTFGEESLVGVNTFLSKYFGMDVFVRNVNLESHYKSGYYLGNVYTFFRRPLHDFGFFGMLVFTALVALFFSWIYYSKIKWKPRTLNTDCWSIVYGYLFYWVLASSIAQNSQTYISLNVLVLILIMVVGYHLLNGIVISSSGLKYREKRTHSRGKIRISVR